MGHSPHVLRGVEIYKGKPILYGLGEFLPVTAHGRLAHERFLAADPVGRGRGAAPATDNITDVANPRPAINFESMVALSRYDTGQFVEVRLYPISGQFEGPLSQLGIPRTAPPAMAQRILARVQALSKPFGTTIAIVEEKNTDRVGVV